MSDIIPILLDARQNGTNASFYDTNSYSPAANQTVILITTGLVNVGEPIVPGVSGNGLTWSLVAFQRYDFAGTDRGIITIYRGLGSSPTVGVTRVQYGALNLRQEITVLQFTQTDIGNLGANAIVGTPVQVKEPISSGLTPSLTPIPAGENIANAQIGAFVYGEPNPLIIPGLGFIELSRLVNAEGGSGQQVQMSQIVRDPVDWLLNVDTAPRAMIAFELRNVNPFVEGAAPAVGGSAFIAGNLIQ